MATTPTPQSRSSLIRQMADELNRDHRFAAPPPSRSNRSSPKASLMPGFDPANEAVVSTSHLEDTQYSLPELRVPGDKPGEPEKRYVIDSSAIARVFPDWGKDSDTTDSTSNSIETGRGKKEIRLTSNRFRRLEEFSSDLQQYNYSDDTELSTKGTGARAQPVRISSTLAQVHSAKKATNERSTKEQAQHDLFAIENKENRQPSTSAAKITDNVSRPTSVRKGKPRVTLAAMHARVTDEEDESLIGEERPPTLDLTSRSTRFSRPNSRVNSVNLSAPTAKADDDLQSKKPEPSKAIPACSPQKAATHQGIPPINPAANVTYQSYVLPDLPNLSELVSGVYEDGTPVFSRRISHASRFGHNQQYQYYPEDDIYHPYVDGVPMPYEEKAILISLRLLQDKVVELEKERAGREKALDELQIELNSLKAEKEQMERRRRSDSALGSGDSGSEVGEGMDKGRRRLATEKSKLEQMIRVLQDRLDAANRKVSVADMSIRHLTQERDAADVRLGLAYCSSEKLQHENQMLRTENEALKKQLAQITEERDAEKQEWSNKEAALKKMLERRNEAVNEARDVTRDLWDLRLPSQSTQRPHDQGLASNNNVASEAQIDSHTQPSPDDAQQSQSNANQDHVAQSSVAAPKQPPKRTRTKMVIVEETIHSEYANQTGTENLNNVYRGDNENESTMSDDSSTGQLTKQSVLHREQLAKLRKLLEEERAKHQTQQVGTVPETSAQIELVHANKTNKPAVVEQKALPRKSSLKASTQLPKVDSGVIENEEHTGKMSIKTGENTEQLSEGNLSADETRHSKATSSHRRRRAGSSRGAVKPHGGDDNMTSAYILPDITIRHPPTQPVVSTHAQCVSNGLAQHDKRNCTLCRAITLDEEKPVSSKTADNTTNTKNVVTIPRPIPVSERMPEPVAYEDEPTIRPSQPPAIALAVVMKALEDELSHLKLEVARYQALYNEHDASLGKHKRKALCKKITTLMKAVDTKADQIYALYDVLEGQKEDGHTMSERQVEVTLHTLGLDLTELSTKAEQKKTTGTTNKEPGKVHDVIDDFSASSDEEELPWEGFEDTAPVSRTGRVDRS